MLFRWSSGKFFIRFLNCWKVMRCVPASDTTGTIRFSVEVSTYNSSVFPRVLQWPRLCSSLLRAFVGPEPKSVGVDVAPVSFQEVSNERLLPEINHTSSKWSSSLLWASPSNKTKIVSSLCLSRTFSVEFNNGVLTLPLETCYSLNKQATIPWGLHSGEFTSCQWDFWWESLRHIFWFVRGHLCGGAHNKQIFAPVNLEDVLLW